ncbi:hypothetical protein F3W81_16190 [Pseudooceanicola spongiae]|uniref:Uncharacterized protein n=1 Tax=Pseudooceanicola spongiae TaxID=2613965 RepID=A0A7L9WSJ0_9RHOB|nr:hypothetical protein F3W81_16190 [Pseudooceanicola spongiae]
MSAAQRQWLGAAGCAVAGRCKPSGRAGRDAPRRCGPVGRAGPDPARTAKPDGPYPAQVTPTHRQL